MKHSLSTPEAGLSGNHSRATSARSIPFHLVETLAISDRGEIGGIGKPPECATHIEECGRAYLLIPCGATENEVGCVELTGDADTATRNSTASFTQGASPMGMSAGPRDIAARIQSQFGRPRGIGFWPQRGPTPR